MPGAARWRRRCWWHRRVHRVAIRRRETVAWIVDLETASLEATAVERLRPFTRFTPANDALCDRMYASILERSETPLVAGSGAIGERAQDAERAALVVDERPARVTGDARRHACRRRSVQPPPSRADAHAALGLELLDAEAQRRVAVADRRSRRCRAVLVDAGRAAPERDRSGSSWRPRGQPDQREVVVRAAFGVGLAVGLHLDPRVVDHGPAHGERRRGCGSPRSRPACRSAATPARQPFVSCRRSCSSSARPGRCTSPRRRRTRSSRCTGRRRGDRLHAGTDLAALSAGAQALAVMPSPAGRRTGSRQARPHGSSTSIPYLDGWCRSRCRTPVPDALPGGTCARRRGTTSP